MKRTAILVSTLLLGACADDLTDAPLQPDKADSPMSTDTAWLRFTKSGASLSGRIVPGQPLVVTYDLDRLPNCRGDINGGPAWQITGNYRVDQGDWHTFGVSARSGSKNIPVDAVIHQVPEGQSLALYFYVSNRWGCIAYDSNQGQNYTYPLSSSPLPSARLSFNADYTTTRSGPLVAGGKLTIHYEDARLPDCRGTQMGHPAWAITGNYGADGKELGTFAVDHDATLTIPAADELELWFYVSNVWGCIAYDSNYGENHRFPIQPAP